MPLTMLEAERRQAKAFKRYAKVMEGFSPATAQFHRNFEKLCDQKIQMMDLVQRQNNVMKKRFADAIKPKTQPIKASRFSDARA